MAQAMMTDKPNTWQYRGGAPDVTLPADILAKVEGNEVLARLLVNRGITTLEAADIFLKEPSKEDLLDVHELEDADIALARIGQALDKNEHILIYGDFDVDGLTGSSIFYETLKTHLNANCSYYIPDRKDEGHGLNTPSLIRLKSSRQVGLLITTDTGISNFAEIAFLKGLGVDTIVTDHHELPENLPLSVANVNPQRFEDPEAHRLGQLSGAGVAYKLCAELLIQRMDDTDAAIAAGDGLLDLCAIGLIADMVPLVGENRLLVQLGLQQLAKRERLGVNLILKNAGVADDAELNSETVGFTIGPRLNALGRLENATEGIEFLTSSDETRAKELALKLEMLNGRRKELCNQTFIEAEQQLLSSGGLDGRKAIILAAEHWNPGVIGIVASRLIEKYNLPTFMMVIEEDEAKVRCSARSIPGFHLTAHLEKLSDYFINMGGHAGAAGFALPLEKLNNFKNDLWKLAAQSLSDSDIHGTIQVDAKLTFEHLHPGFVDQLGAMAPFGMHNPSPVFVMEDMAVGAQRLIGTDQNHLKAMLQPSERNGIVKGQLQHVEAFLWKCGSNFKLDSNKHYHVACTIEKNSFPNGTPVRLTIKDIQPANKGKYSTVHETQGAVAPAPTLAKQLEASMGKTVSSPPIPLGILQVSPSPVGAGSVPARIQETAWIDHRSRPQAGEFVSQMLMSGDTNTLIYNEGKAPDIPFIKPDQVMSRLNCQPCDALVLWDIPPSAEAMDTLLHATHAKTIHLVGAKYQKVQLDMETAAFLKAMHQGLTMLLAKQPQGIPLSVLASRFATTEDCLLAAISVLNTSGFPYSLAENTLRLETGGNPHTLIRSEISSPNVCLLNRLKAGIQAYRRSVLDKRM